MLTVFWPPLARRLFFGVCEDSRGILAVRSSVPFTPGSGGCTARQYHDNAAPANVCYERAYEANVFGRQRVSLAYAALWSHVGHTSGPL